MNDMAKNLILWLIIAAVLVTVMNNFSSPNEPQTLNYSDFIQQVKDGKVERVAVDDDDRRIAPTLVRVTQLGPEDAGTRR